MRTPTNPRRAGIFLLGTSLALAVVYPLCQREILQFLTIYGSPDHRITPHGVRELVAAYYFGTVVLFGLGLAGLSCRDPMWCTRARLTFTADPACPNRRGPLSPALTLPVATLVGLALVISMRLTPRFQGVFLFLYAKDHGLLDVLVPVSMVVGAMLLGSTAWAWRRTRPIDHSVALPQAVYMLLMTVFIGVAGEEVSWGQDLFGWSAPSAFSGNVEGQTNLHNFFNAYFDYGYIALAMILVIVLMSAWLEFTGRWQPWNRWFLPHPSLLGLSLIIAFVAIVWYREEELLEELVAAFTLFYTYRIFTCVRSHNLRNSG